MTDPTAADVLFPGLEYSPVPTEYSPVPAQSTPVPAQSTPPVTQFTSETAGHEYPNGMRFITHGPTERIWQGFRLCLCGKWIGFDGWEEHIGKVTATALPPVTQPIPETAGFKSVAVRHGFQGRISRGFVLCLCGKWVNLDAWKEHLANVTITAIRSGDRIATGTGAARRRLTQAEAEAGGLPEPFTKDEWRAMADASRGAR